ncbi:MAG: iron-containing alcohol dehydrogenase [Spirochaetes bacterium]|nr:iron-containing alcohol dehydrogenase [Spirochaetota bacterium]
MGEYGLKSTLILPKQILFGTGVRADLAKLAKRFGNKVLLVYGGRSFAESGMKSEVSGLFGQAGMEVYEMGGTGHDPDEDTINRAVVTVLDIKPDCIVGIGGGSVIDTAKAASIIVTNGGAVKDYWGGRKFVNPSIPYIAVPTTAGTGAEVTKNAVITSADKSYKKSIRSELMIPDIALVDPSLTLTVPPPVTADTGLDALVQNIEAYTSKNSGPITDTLARKGIELAGRYLVRGFEDPADLEAREALSLASLYGGITLLNAGLGLAHGLSHPIGIRFGVPHGRACAAVMPKVMEYNYPAQKRKYDEIGMLLGAKNSIDGFIGLIEKLDIPRRLRLLGITEADLKTIVTESRGGSRNYNPIPHTDETVEKMLREML